MFKQRIHSTSEGKELSDRDQKGVVLRSAAVCVVGEEKYRKFQALAPRVFLPHNDYKTIEPGFGFCEVHVESREWSVELFPSSAQEV